MDKKYTKTRLTAMMCVFVFVFGLVLSGCASVKKVAKGDNTYTDADGVIHIGDANGDGEGTSQIVVGSDGKSYLVDGQGNSVVYDATSAYAVNNGTNTTKATASSNNTTKATAAKTTTKATAAKTTTSAISSSSDVYNAVAAQRKFGFNKYYDKYAGLANFYLDTIRAYFTYNGKDWLVEFWKGEYAMAAVGCEIGYYYRDSDGKVATMGADNLLYASVEDKDAMMTSMELWQYKKKTDTTPTHIFMYDERNCWWAAQFETGVLYRHSDRTSLVMRGTIKFPNTEMMNLFLDALEDKGFTEGSTSSYFTTEKYSVSGTKVTVMWKNFKES